MIMKRIGFVLLVIFILIGICNGAEENIYKIMILGNIKIEEGVIQGAIKSREGSPFSPEKVREDLRSIFNLGFFTDVQVDIKSTPQGKEIIFIVVEKPSIKEILITGNQKVKRDDIKEKMTLKPRSILNLDKVKEDSEQIRKLYFSKGYYGVKVEYKVDYLEANEAVIIFTISEGPKGHIKKIVFKGNKHIKSSELKKVMTTSQWNILSIITQTGTLDEDVLKNDLQLLNAYYVDHGYLDAKISEPKVDLSDPKRIRIEIEITEGPLYRLGDIDFKGDVLTAKEDLFKAIKIKRGDVYSNSAIRKDINSLTEKFSNQGYAYVEINPETAVDSKNLLVHLTFDIEKKKQVSYEKIQIVGNKKTRDKVIRRELQVVEGELYNATKMNKSRDRLKRTGFFKEVDFATSRGSTEEKINLDLKVEEAPTGSLTFGVGYSNTQSLVGTASLSDRNLFGMGYHAYLKAAVGLKTLNFRTGLTDPYFLGYPFAAGFDLYDEKDEYFKEYYKYNIIGGDIRFGKELTDYFRIDAMYKLEKVNIYDVSPLASTYIKEMRGKTATSVISVTPSFDNRDDYFNPRRGGKHSLMIANAGGILGGDNYFVKAVGTTSWFFPLPLNSTLNLRASAGVILPYGGKRAVYDDNGLFVGYRERVPLTEKFYVGGSGTIRGFEYGMAGPRDINNEPVGAKNMVVFNTELIFPISKAIGLRGALFFDIGKAWGVESTLSQGAIFNRGVAMGVGPGIRWFSPFGPIAIDLGFNLNPKHGEKSHVIDFSAGTSY
jgi:outer membrane protein insertion porin family